LYFPKLNAKKVEQFVSFRNEELVDKALSKANGTQETKGIFFLSGHISNWELTAFAYSLIFHRRLNIIAKIQSNKKVNNRINSYRELSGNEIIEISASLRTIYSKIKNNEIVCFLVDQSANPDYSVYVDFFGRKVATFDGPAKMALKYIV
jgi:lauroyl/myristoyl acyltransferase